MSDKNKEVFCSNIFRFDIGVNKKRLHVHQEAVARVSDPLMAMMTNGLKESCEGFATLDQVDENTFARFLEFVYSGNYNAAEYEEEDQKLAKDGLSDQPSDEIPVEIGSRDGCSPHFGRNRRRKVYTSPPRECYPRLIPPIVLDVTRIDPFPTMTAAIDNMKDPHRGYSSTLLSHVRLFEFAETYLVEKLKEATIQDLSIALDSFTLHWQRVPDVVKLVRHIYDVSPEPREAHQSCPSLRQVITRFAANNIDILVASETFQDLLVGGGLFAKDLMVSVVERMQ